MDGSMDGSIVKWIVCLKELTRREGGKKKKRVFAMKFRFVRKLFIQPVLRDWGSYGLSHEITNHQASSTIHNHHKSRTSKHYQPSAIVDDLKHHEQP